MSFTEGKSDKELKDLYHGLYESVYVSESSGTHDVVELEAVTAELVKRGYEFKQGRPLIVKRKERCVMTYRSTWIIHFDESKTDSSELRRQISLLPGVKIVGCTGKKRVEEV
jgi:hypothetical protein